MSFILNQVVMIGFGAVAKSLLTIIKNTNNHLLNH